MAYYRPYCIADICDDVVLCHRCCILSIYSIYMLAVHVLVPVARILPVVVHAIEAVFVAERDQITDESRAMG